MMRRIGICKRTGISRAFWREGLAVRYDAPPGVGASGNLYAERLA